MIRLDLLHRPYGELPRSEASKLVAEAADALRKAGAEKIIYPPLHELAHPDAVPLFRTYLEEAFSHSLIGKIGLIAESGDATVAQEVITSLNFPLTPAQQGIKKFQQPRAFWVKSVTTRTTLAAEISHRDPLVNRLVKHDMRYFKDAAVDTVIPLSRGHFAFERVLQRFFTFSKIRFHGLRVDALGQGSGGGVTMLIQGDAASVRENKKLMALLTAGGKQTVSFQ